MNSFEELKKKFPMNRNNMTEEQEREYVNHCFDLYEKEGFAKVFWSEDCEFRKYNNQPFKVIGRLDENDANLEFLPMWQIKFKDGESLQVSDYEIIPSKMIKHGCKLKLI